MAGDAVLQRIPGIALAEVYDARYGEPMPRGLSRQGCMIHFDDSSSDRGGIQWLRRAKLGYTWAVRDDGGIVQLEPPGLKTPHAGTCRTPNANSVFYGIAALTNNVTPATPEQLEAIATIVVCCWRYHRAGANGWGEPSTAALIRRIQGHDTQAVYPKVYPADHPKAGQPHPLAGKLGRKVDPTGYDPKTRKPRTPPILSVATLRERVRARLIATDFPHLLAV